MHKPLIALSSGSLHSYGLSRAFALAKECGFEGVEVMVDSRWDTRHPEYLQSLSDHFDIPVAALHTPFVSSVPGWMRDDIGRLKQTIELAQMLDVRTVIAHLPIRWSRALLHVPSLNRTLLALRLPFTGSARYARFLTEELAELQASTPVKIAVENMPHERFMGRTVSGYKLNTFEELEKFPNLTFDTTHFATAGVDILSAWDRLAHRVAHVHLSNYQNGREHQLLEHGQLRLDRLLRRMVADGYQGVVSVELSPEPLGASDEGQVREHLRRSYRFCREHLAQATLHPTPEVILSAPSLLRR